LIKVAPAIIDRFLYAPEESGESRSLANEAAIAMANDNFFGVGINNYSHAINETDYIRFIDNPVDRGIVHNIYLLHACEMGWLGLVVFLLMIANFFVIGLRMVAKRRDNMLSFFATGIVVAMFTLRGQTDAQEQETGVCQALGAGEMVARSERKQTAAGDDVAAGSHPQAVVLIQ